MAEWSFGGKIGNCSASGNVSSSGSNSEVGDVAGYQYGSSITVCSSTAKVCGILSASGIAGVSDANATLTGSYATDDVTFENDGTGNAFASGWVRDNGSSLLPCLLCLGQRERFRKQHQHRLIGGVTGANVSGTLTACYHATLTVCGHA